MSHLREIQEELNDCLAGLDGLRNDLPGVLREDFEEWNAVFEDALFLLEVGDEEDEADVLRELRELREHYRACSGHSPGLSRIVRRLDGLLSDQR